MREEKEVHAGSRKGQIFAMSESIFVAFPCVYKIKNLNTVYREKNLNGRNIFLHSVMLIAETVCLFR